MIFEVESFFHPRQLFPILSVFSNCHLKFIYDENGLRNVDSFGISNFQWAASNLFVYSLSVVQFGNDNKNDTNSSQEFTFTNYHNSSRFTQCFLHVYMEDELSDFGSNYTNLFLTMAYLRYFGEWPNHFLFAGNFYRYSVNQTINRFKFYQITLSRTFVRGIVFTIDYNDKSNNCTVYRLCITCISTLHAVKYKNIQNTGKVHFSLTQDLEDPQDATRGNYLILGLDDLQDIRYACDIGSPNFRPKYFQRKHSICALYLLQNYHNFTFFSFHTYDNTTKALFFQTSPGYFVGLNNYGIYLYRQWEWVPYDIRTSPYDFVGFQVKSRVSPNMLIKPYTWPSWLLFIFAILALALIKAIFRISFEKALWDEGCRALLSLVSIALEQPILDSPNHEFISAKIVALCWLLWSLVMVVFSNGYKAMVFSFMTKDSGYSWPANLQQLVADTSYVLLSNERVYITENGSYILIPFLEDFFGENPLNGTPGKDFPMEYHILNKSTIQSVTNDTLDLVGSIVWESMKTGANYKIGNASSSKFAFLAREPQQFMNLITYFKQELAASVPVSIPGFERTTPWSAYRNHLAKSFTTSLAQLEQAGYFIALKRHRDRWSPCNSMADVEEKLEHKYNFSNSHDEVWNADVKRCLAKAFAGKTTGHLLGEVSGERPLTTREVGAPILVLFTSLAVAFCLLISEWIISKLQRPKQHRHLFEHQLYYNELHFIQVQQQN